MNKILKLFCLIIILLNICGCLKKEEKKGIEKPVPKIVAKNTDNDRLTWIKNEYTDTIPKFIGGKDKEVYSNTEAGFVFGAFDVTEEEYKDYLIEIKDYGYNKKAMEVTSSYKAFTSSNGEYQLVIGYSDGYMTITVTKEN